MSVLTMASAVAATGAQAAVTPPYKGNAEAVFQVEITGTATVDLEGRVSPSAPWVMIHQSTASEIKAVVPVPEMRVNVTAYTSGAVNAWLLP